MERGAWMETYRKFAAFGKSIVVGPESESLGDVCTSSCKLNSKLGGNEIEMNQFHSNLLDGLRVFCSSLRSPGPSGGVAALLEGHDVRAVAKDHLAACQPADQALLESREWKKFHPWISFLDETSKQKHLSLSLSSSLILYLCQH